MKLHERLFSYVHSSHLVYNTCWEDPRIDREALDFTSDDRVLVITSAGCNALDYLLAGAGKIDAVDVNPRQNHLLELKIAAAKALEWDEYFQMFGRGWLPALDATFSRVDPHLSEPGRDYWLRQRSLFRRAAWAPSFYFRGASGVLARGLNWYIDHLARVRSPIEALLDTESITSQRRIYVRHVRPRFWSRGAGILSDSSLLLSCAGVPPAQAAAFAGGTRQFVRRAIDTVFGKLPLSDNYFWRVYLTGSYSPSCCPEYLKERNFGRLKESVQDRIHTFTESVEDRLRKSSEPYTKVILLDHMDWMFGYRPDLLQREWQALIDNVASGARIIWRSAHRDPTFIDSICVDARGRAKRLGELLFYDQKRAQSLHRADRVHTYASLALAQVA